MSSESNKTLARRLTEALDEGNADELHELLSPDFVSHFGGSPQPLNREQYIQVNTMAKAAFADLKRMVEDLIAEGDKVAVRITARGSHTGTFQGIAATGKRTEITGIAIRQIADGKIVAEWVVNDQLGLLQQIGVIPPRDQAGS